MNTVWTEFVYCARKTSKDFLQEKPSIPIPGTLTDDDAGTVCVLISVSTLSRRGGVATGADAARSTAGNAGMAGATAAVEQTINEVYK